MADKKVGNLTLGVQAQVKGFEGAIGGIAKLGLAITGIQVIAKTAAKAITNFTDAANEQELVESRLAAAMQATGNYTKENFKILEGYAAAIQQITTVGDEATLGAMELALSMGVQFEQIELATRGAVGLSKAYKMDMKAAMKVVALAMEGDFAMMARFIPAMKGMKDKTKMAELAMRAMADGFKIAEAEAKTAGGQLLQLKGRIGDLQQEIGRVLNRGLYPLIKSVKDLLELHLDEIVANIVITGDALAASWETLKTVADWIRIAFDMLALQVMSGITLVSEGIKIWADSMITVVRGLAWVIDRVFKTDLVTGIDNFRKGVDNALGKPLQISKMLLGDIKKTFDSIYGATTPVKNDMEDIADAAEKTALVLSGKTGGEAGIDDPTGRSGLLKFRGRHFMDADEGIKEIVKDTEDWNDKLQLVANSFDVIFDKTRSMQSKMEDILKLILRFGIGLAAQSNPALAPFAPIIGGIIGGAFSGGGGGTVININNPLLSDQTSYENIANNIRNGLLKSSMNNGGVISV